MSLRKIIINAPEEVHKAVKVAAARSEKSINSLCLTAIEANTQVRQAMCDLKKGN